MENTLPARLRNEQDQAVDAQYALVRTTDDSTGRQPRDIQSAGYASDIDAALDEAPDRAAALRSAQGDVPPGDDSAAALGAPTANEYIPSHKYLAATQIDAAGRPGDGHPRGRIRDEYPLLSEHYEVVDTEHHQYGYI